MNLSTNQGFNCEELSTQLRTRLARASITDIEVLDNIASTNSALMHRSFLEVARPASMLWALTQTSGRGRRGRVWQSSPEYALTFSLSFETEVREHSKLASLSPAAGLSLAMALSRISPGIQVKWPNDLWRKGKKIAGILLEATQKGKIQRVVIGIGINLFWPSQPPATEPVAATAAFAPQKPGGMFDDPISVITKLDVLTTCAKSMATLFQESQDPNVNSAAWFENWSDFDALAGERVNLFQDGQVLASGINAGVDRDGAFLMKPQSQALVSAQLNSTAPSLQRFEIGEISLRSAVPTDNT
jgi:BirA family transcriptional regulator, biotin operon repressor / biotin---[acetyl-CoA-carboxylase] ligase